MITEIRQPPFDVSRDAVSRLPERLIGDFIGRHFRSFRIEENLTAIAEMEKIPGHGGFLHLAGAHHISQSPRGQRKARR
jgi:hypothetical protein